MKVLVVDDARDLVEIVLLCFEMRWPRSTVLSAETAEEGIRLARVEKPDMVILDVGLPDGDGFQVCRSIRSFSTVPIIMLTIHSDEKDIVKGLEWGADDYIVKPFSPLQFLARVQAVLRRSPPFPLATGDQPFKVGALVLRPDTRQVEVRGQPVHLTTIEYNVLYQLLKELGRPLSTQDLLLRVWGPQYQSATYLPKVYIQHLRRKLEQDPEHPRMILTERGVGYKFAANE